MTPDKLILQSRCYVWCARAFMCVCVCVCMCACVHVRVCVCVCVCVDVCVHVCMRGRVCQTRPTAHAALNLWLILDAVSSPTVVATSSRNGVYRKEKVPVALEYNRLKAEGLLTATATVSGEDNEMKVKSDEPR